MWWDEWFDGEEGSGISAWDLSAWTFGSAPEPRELGDLGNYLGSADHAWGGQNPGGVGGAGGVSIDGDSGQGSIESGFGGDVAFDNYGGAVVERQAGYTEPVEVTGMLEPSPYGDQGSAAAGDASDVRTGASGEAPGSPDGGTGLAQSTWDLVEAVYTVMQEALGGQGTVEGSLQRGTDAGLVETGVSVETSLELLGALWADFGALDDLPAPRVSVSGEVWPAFDTDSPEDLRLAAAGDAPPPEFYYTRIAREDKAKADAYLAREGVEFLGIVAGDWHFTEPNVPGETIISGDYFYETMGKGQVLGQESSGVPPPAPPGTVTTSVAQGGAGEDSVGGTWLPDPAAGARFKDALDKAAGYTVPPPAEGPSIFGQPFVDAPPLTVEEIAREVKALGTGFFGALDDVIDETKRQMDNPWGQVPEVIRAGQRITATARAQDTWYGGLLRGTNKEFNWFSRVMEGSREFIDASFAHDADAAGRAAFSLLMLSLTAVMIGSVIGRKGGGTEAPRTSAGGNPAVGADPWSPGSVAARAGTISKPNGPLAAKALGYEQRISPQKAGFDPHGQPVYSNGKNYITPDVDSHAGGVWKMFDRAGNRIGT